MTRFAVEFRGLLLDPHRLRLHEAGITAESSKADFRDDVMYSGQQFHTVTVEAESATKRLLLLATPSDRTYLSSPIGRHHRLGSHSYLGPKVGRINPPSRPGRRPASPALRPRCPASSGRNGRG